MGKTQILCSFITNKATEESLLDLILDNYTITNSKIRVLTAGPTKTFLMYVVDSKEQYNKLPNTITVQYKSETNTIFTINGLNEIIKRCNNGVLDKSFAINWENYSDTLIVTISGELFVFPTKQKNVRIVKYAK